MVAGLQGRTRCISVNRILTVFPPSQRVLVAGWLPAPEEVPAGRQRGALTLAEPAGSGAHDPTGRVVREETGLRSSSRDCRSACRPGHPALSAGSAFIAQRTQLLDIALSSRDVQQ